MPANGRRYLIRRLKFNPPEEFEPAIPSREQPQTHTLDGAAAGIGLYLIHHINSLYFKSVINFCEGARTPNMNFNIYILKSASEFWVLGKSKNIFISKNLANSLELIPQWEADRCPYVKETRRF